MPEQGEQNIINIELDEIAFHFFFFFTEQLICANKKEAVGDWESDILFMPFILKSINSSRLPLAFLIFNVA